MDRVSRAAVSLHGYLMSRHWDGSRLVGPDPGIRFNYRIGRFIKSYLPVWPWRDRYCYLQGQGYWVLANWELAALTGGSLYRDIAVRCSAAILDMQRPDGAWDYPNPEWHGRVATVEGTWASLGLLETYRQTGDARFLDGALRWHAYMVREIGFQQVGDTLALNYFAHRAGDRVPNMSAFGLPFLAALAAATGDRAYLEPCPGMVRFIQEVQMESGEIPYAVPGADGGDGRPHFQCFQYNAYQCLDLLSYYRMTGDPDALRIAERVLGFLRQGLVADGHARYDCHNHRRAVVYHAAALGAAFAEAGRQGIGGYEEYARRAFDYVLRAQRPDGGFPHSRGDYRVLSDRRSYPRYQAMILHHLLQGPTREVSASGDAAARQRVG